jgi:hypothetical protein
MRRRRALLPTSFTIFQPAQGGRWPARRCRTPGHCGVRIPESVRCISRACHLRIRCLHPQVSDGHRAVTESVTRSRSHRPLVAGARPRDEVPFRPIQRVRPPLNHSSKRGSGSYRQRELAGNPRREPSRSSALTDSVAACDLTPGEDVRSARRHGPRRRRAWRRVVEIFVDDGRLASAT